MKVENIAVLGALGIGAAIIAANWKSIGNMFNNPTAQAIGGTAAGVASAVPIVVSIPYQVGSEIGGELGTAWGNIFNSVWGLWNRNSEQLASNQNVLNALQAAQEEYRRTAGSGNRTSSFNAETSYVNARLSDLDLEFSRGQVTQEAYFSVRDTLLQRLANLSGNHNTTQVIPTPGTPVTNENLEASILSGQTGTWVVAPTATTTGVGNIGGVTTVIATWNPSWGVMPSNWGR